MARTDGQHGQTGHRGEMSLYMLSTSIAAHDLYRTVGMNGGWRRQWVAQMVGGMDSGRWAWMCGVWVRTAWHMLSLNSSCTEFGLPMH